ncbi:MAG: rod shape-determining protein RodA [Prevotellaceae bacterium]|jgi:rod shape determining protein RodA|nr:rod shape-determining protein RodA [Prevotellaceae bacterium]
MAYRRSNNLLARVDWSTVLIWMALMAIGLLCIYTSGFNEDYPRFFDAHNQSRNQAIWVGMACVIAILVMMVERQLFNLLSTGLYIFALLLVVFTLIFGQEINGSKSWLSLGVVSIQPVEFMKVATALMLAKVVSAHGFRMQNLGNAARAIAVILAPFMLTLLQHDTGSALVFTAFIIVLYRAGLRTWILISCLFLIFLFILSLLVEQAAILIFISLLCNGIFMVMSRRYKTGFVNITIVAVATLALHFGLRQAEIYLPLFEALILAHAAMLPIIAIYAWWHRLRYIFFIVGFFIVSCGITYSVDYVFDNVLKEHQRRRINDMLGIESDIKGWGYNVHQSKIAIGSGGLTGKGFMGGMQTKGNFVPEQSTDFIFCTVGEEWGFLGATLVVGLYLLLLIRVLNMAERQKSAFAKFYGYGVAAILFFHVAVNIGMTIGIMPVVGIPLPFLSYGGSSLWAFTILLFVLLKFDVARYEY